MSKYGELARTIRASILDGTYRQGTRLPTTPELCDRYHVSNTTVKKAMDELEREGLVARRRGSGVYVKETSRIFGLQGSWSISGQMAGLTAEFAAQGKTVTSVVNDFSIVHPSEEVAEGLAIQPDSFVYAICRTRVVDDVPKNVEYTFMPIELIPGLRNEHLHRSIYAYIEDALGLKIASAHRVIRAVVPTDDERWWLRVEGDLPLLEVRQVGYLDDGTPFEFSTTRHTCDYEFRIVSTH